MFRQSPGGKRIVAVVGLGQLLGWASSYYLVAVLGAPMAAGFGLPRVAVFAMFSAALLVSALLGPFAGHQVDRYGGRRVLLASNAVFAAALLVMATAHSPVQLAAGWLLMGVAMPLGLYDAAFATVVRHFGSEARSSIVAVTLIAGFASSASWPLSHFLESHHGWRSACLAWAALHLLVGASLHGFGLPEDSGLAMHHRNPAAPGATSAPGHPTLWLLMAIYAATGFVFAALAAHLPRLLQVAGCSPDAAIAAASLVGIFQVAGRVAEAGYLKRLHPFVSAFIATTLHPVGAVLMLIFGAPAAMLFTALHGAGVGLMTIVKGTLPLALFGAAGFGRRAGLLEGPSKICQAIAPIVFSLWLDAWGDGVLWITGALTSAAFVGIWWLSRRADV